MGCVNTENYANYANAPKQEEVTEDKVVLEQPCEE